MPKTNQNSGFKKSGSLYFTFHSEEDFKKIADTLGINQIPQEVKKELNDAKREYVYNRDVMSKYPRAKAVKPILLDLHKKAEAFLDSLQQIKKTHDGLCVEMLSAPGGDLDPDLYAVCIDMLSAIGQDKDLPQQAIQDTDFPHTLDRCIADTERISKAASLAIELLNKIKDRGGPNSKEDLKIYISDLSHIFKGLTGKKATVTTDNYNEELPYSGLFFRFVETCLEITEPNKFDKKALGAMVKRVIRNPYPEHFSIPTVD